MYSYDMLSVIFFKSILNYLTLPLGLLRLAIFATIWEISGERRKNERKTSSGLLVCYILLVSGTLAVPFLPSIPRVMRDRENCFFFSKMRMEKCTL